MNTLQAEHIDEDVLYHYYDVSNKEPIVPDASDKKLLNFIIAGIQATYPQIRRNVTEVVPLTADYNISVTLDLYDEASNIAFFVVIGSEKTLADISSGKKGGYQLRAAILYHNRSKDNLRPSKYKIIFINRDFNKIKFNKTGLMSEFEITPVSEEEITDHLKNIVLKLFIILFH